VSNGLLCLVQYLEEVGLSSLDDLAPHCLGGSCDLQIVPFILCVP